MLTKKNKKFKFSTISAYAFLVFWLALTLFPMLWIVLNSLKENSEIYAHPFGMPQIFRFGNYVVAWQKAQIGINFLNSIVISFTSVTVILMTAAMASYVIGRLKPNLLLYTYFTIGIMIPIQAILIPSFILIKEMGQHNSRLGLILIYIGSNLSFAIFLLVSFIKTIPMELEEAALLDGCGRTETFFRIILPLCKGGLATAGIFSFLNTWNEYLFASVLISTPQLKTLTQGIAALRGQHFTDYAMLSAGLIIGIVPVVIVYLIFQEQVIEGMTSGAVKG